MVRRTQSLLLGTALLLGACSHEHQSSAEAAKFEAAMDAVCQAQTFASQRNYRGSSDAFYDNAHGYLHALAAKIQGRDADVAGKLLETKEQVEVAFRDPSFYGPQVIVQRLTSLQEAMRRAARVLELPEVGCAA